MAIAHDQNLGTNTGPTSAGTITLTTLATVAAGGKIVLEIANFNAANDLSSVSGGGLTWVIDLKAVNGSQHLARVSADAPAGLASGTVITATYSASTSDRSISGYSITGLNTGVSLDGTNSSSTGSGATWTSGAVNTTNANNLMAAGGFEDGATTTCAPNGGWNEENDFNNATSTECWESVYQITSATGSYTAGGTFLASGTTSLGSIVAYKGPASAPVGGYVPVRIANPRVGPMALRQQLRRVFRRPPSPAPPSGSTVTFDVTIAGVGSVVPSQLARTRAISVSIAGTGAVSAAMVRQRAIAATIAAIAAVTVNIVRQRALALAVAGLGALGVNIVRQRALAAVANGTATVLTDRLAVQRALASVIAGNAQVVATLDLPAGHASVVANERDYFVVIHHYRGA